MQLLLDSAVETPAGLRRAALVLSYWASLEEAAALGNEASINGPGDEITLHEHTHDRQPGASTAALNAPFTTPAARDPNTDPYAAFAGKLGSVPAGTTGDAPNPPTPAAPVGNASLGDAAATGTPLAAAPAAPPMPNAAPAVVNPPASAHTGTSASSAAADVDKAGIKWDARVHSDTKKQNADGTWRFRRNLDEAVKATVMAELKAAAAGQSSLVPDAPAAPEAPPPPVDPNAPPVPLPAAPLPVSAPSNVGVPDPPNAGVVYAPATGFRELMTKINKARAAGHLTQEQVDAALTGVSLKGVTELAAQPALVPQVDAALNVILSGVAA